MINTLLNYLSDTEFQLRAGRITYGLPARRLYRVAPYGELSGTSVYAVPLDVCTHGGLGATPAKSYAVGDNVLFIQGTTDTSSGVPYGLILGTCPIAVSGTDNSTLSEELVSLFDETFIETPSSDSLDSFGGDISEQLANTLQILEMLGNNGFANTNNVDNLPGDYNISGADTELHVDDLAVQLRAGKSGISLNSVYDMLDVYSTLFRKVSAASYEQLFLINDNFFHIALKGLTTRDCYTKGSKPVFRHLEELSNYIYGRRTATLSPDGLEISSISETFDGKINIEATNGVSIKKTVRVKKSLTPKNIPVRYNEGAEITDLESLEKIAENKDLWEISETKATDKPDILQSPQTNEAYAQPQYSGTFSDGVTEDPIEYVKAEAVIRTLPSGGILIRDAWGSEIRMEGGNIQISAANNVTTVAGRDILSICNGVASTNAGDSVQIGAAKRSVSLQGETGIDLCAKTGDIRAIGESLSIETAKMNADTNITRLKSGNTIIGGDRVVINASELVAHGNVASISGSASGLVLSSGAVLGANSFVVNGPTSIRKGGLTISGIPTVDGDSVEVKTNKAPCVLSVDGAIATTGAIAASQHIVTAEGVYANNFAAKTSGVGKLKNRPDKVKIGSNTPLDYNITGNTDTIKDTMTYFKKLKEKALFNLYSKACAIWQPVFSKLGSKLKITIATYKEKNYIYPGKSFWEKDGMLLDEGDEKVFDDPEYTYKTAGVSTLMLNTPNTEESGK